MATDRLGRAFSRLENYVHGARGGVVAEKDARRAPVYLDPLDGVHGYLREVGAGQVDGVDAPAVDEEEDVLGRRLSVAPDVDICRFGIAEQVLGKDARLPLKDIDEGLGARLPDLFGRDNRHVGGRLGERGLDPRRGHDDFVKAVRLVGKGRGCPRYADRAREP